MSRANFSRVPWFWLRSSNGNNSNNVLNVNNNGNLNNNNANNSGGIAPGFCLSRNKRPGLHTAQHL